MDTAASKSPSQSLWVKNSADVPITLCLEPWGDERSIPPRATYLVVLEGPEGGYPAVEWGDRRITVYGWSGSVASVHLDEKIVSLPGKVPAMPQE
jgi:hypothetical protein